MYNNLMIDVEALSLQSNAAILQIAAIPFRTLSCEPGTDPAHRHRNDKFVQPEYIFNERIWPGSYPREGFDVSDSTLAWWDTQDKATRKLVFSGMTDTEIIAKRFIDWLTTFQDKLYLAPPESLRIWARNNQYDFPVIKNWLEQCGQQWPFHHRMTREYYNEIENVPSESYNHLSNHTWHDAACDCIHQIKVIQFCQDYKADFYANNSLSTGTS